MRRLLPLVGLCSLVSFAACIPPVDFQEQEPNNNTTVAKSVGTPSPSILIGASINPANDIDFFKFTLPTTGDVRLEILDGRTEGGCQNIDTFLELINSDGSSVLASNDDASPQTSCSLLDPEVEPGVQRLSAGTYFAKVTEFASDEIIPFYELEITVTALCGDGDVTGSELCDDGNTDNGDGCSGDCGGLEQCGDGRVDPGEVCDDGNVEDGDGCRADCAGVEVCGDTLVDADETCDDGNTDNEDGCNNVCLVESCGDGVVQFGLAEQCDDGNNEEGDNCFQCKLEACGNGILNIDEECDDGNVVGNDGCDFLCNLEVCGDGFLQNGIDEECDDSNTTSGDGCSAACLLEFCGDGIVTESQNEQCDDGNNTNGDGCDADCLFEPACGNGITDTDEQCDDGNTTAGDGCNAVCANEPGNFGEIEPNNGLGLFQFKNVGSPNVVVHASIVPANDVDFFQFTLTSNANLHLETFGANGPGDCNGVDTTIELINTPDGFNFFLLAANDDAANNVKCSLLDSSSTPQLVNLPAGDYFVRVTEFGQNAEIPNYNLKISVNP